MMDLKRVELKNSNCTYYHFIPFNMHIVQGVYTKDSVPITSQLQQKYFMRVNLTELC